MIFIELTNIVMGFFEVLYNYGILSADALPSQATVMIISGGNSALMLILMAWGLYTMARKAGLKHKWRAAVPFVNKTLVGDLSGDGIFFIGKIKKIGIYVAVLEFVALASGALFFTSTIFLEPYASYDQAGQIIFSAYPESLDWAYRAYKITRVTSNVLNIVYSLALICMLVPLFRKYSPRDYFFSTIICVLLPVLPIFICVLCNREPVDFEAYIKQRYQQYSQQNPNGSSQSFFGNPNNGQPQNPYQNFYPRNEQTKKPDDPFAEFSNETSPFDEFAKKKDDADDKDKNGGGDGERFH